MAGITVHRPGGHVCDVQQVGTYLVGPDKTGNARGAYAIDIQTKRGAAANVASGDNSIAIGVSAQSGGIAGPVAIGEEAYATDGGLAIGYRAEARNAGTAIGWQAYGRFGGFALGMNAYSRSGGLGVGYRAYQKTYSAAIGYNASAKDYSVAIGYSASAMQAANDIAIGRAVATDATYAIAIGSVAYNVKMERDGTLSMMDWKVRRNPVAQVWGDSTHKLSIDLNGSTYYVMLHT